MKEFTAKETKKRIDQEFEQMKDIIEILEASIKIRHPMWPEELKALKEAFEAHDSDDYSKCRTALLVYLEYVYDDILLFDLSKWNLKHIFRWKIMLEETELGHESEGEIYPNFYSMIQDEILHRIPSPFLLAYKDSIKDLSPAFIQMLQNYTECMLAYKGFLKNLPPGFKDFVKDLSPEFIEMLQNFTDDKEDFERYLEIYDFLKKPIESGIRNQSK